LLLQRTDSSILDRARMGCGHRGLPLPALVNSMALSFSGAFVLRCSLLQAAFGGTLDRGEDVLDFVLDTPPTAVMSAEAAGDPAIDLELELTGGVPAYSCGMRCQEYSLRALSSSAVGIYGRVSVSGRIVIVEPMPSVSRTRSCAPTPFRGRCTW
jgi:hypothetical protein